MRASIGTVGATAGMRAHATHLLLLTTALRCPPPRCDVSVRLVDDSELSDKDAPLFDPLASTIAQCMFNPQNNAELATYAKETRRNLVDVFAGSHRREPTAVGRSALLVAEDDESGALVGVAGIQAISQTPDGRGEDQQRFMKRDKRALMDVRPLLSNVAVVPSHRRQGIASRMVQSAEDVVRAWGFDELLLLVNERNGGARALYAQRGYTVEGEPLDGEECDIQALWFFGGGQRVTWRTCKNVCMRRQGLSGLT